jgi:hypothetical protein
MLLRMNIEIVIFTMVNVNSKRTDEFFPTYFILTNFGTRTVGKTICAYLPGTSQFFLAFGFLWNCLSHPPVLWVYTLYTHRQNYRMFWLLH